MPRLPSVTLSCRRTGACVAPAGTGRDVPRQQVLVGRVHVDRMRRPAAVGEQRVPVARRAALLHPAAKGRALRDLRLVGRRAQAVREDAPQVVRDAAAAEHQHAFGGERRERRAEPELLGRALVGHEGERQDRDVGVGVDEAQGGPGAVVEAAFGDRLHRDAGGTEQRGDARRERRCAGRVVAQRLQLRVEAAEVVDRLVARGGEQHRHARRGVRGDRDDRARASERRIDLRAETLHEGAGRTRLERDHRRAVRDEEGGQCGGHEVITAPGVGCVVRPDCTQRSGRPSPHRRRLRERTPLRGQGPGLGAARRTRVPSADEHRSFTRPIRRPVGLATRRAPDGARLPRRRIAAAGRRGDARGGGAGRGRLLRRSHQRRAGARCPPDPRRRCDRRERPAGAGGLRRTRPRPRPDDRDDRGVSEHGARAGRQGRRLAPGHGQGGQRRLSAARPAAHQRRPRHARRLVRRRARAGHRVGRPGAARRARAAGRRCAAARRLEPAHREDDRHRARPRRRLPELRAARADERGRPRRRPA